MKNGSPSGGFTVIETLIVLAIIGLLAAIAIPNFFRAKAETLHRMDVTRIMKSDKPMVPLLEGWFYTKSEDLSLVKSPDGSSQKPILVIHAKKSNRLLYQYHYLNNLSHFGSITNGYYFRFQQ